MEYSKANWLLLLPAVIWLYGCAGQRDDKDTIRQPNILFIAVDDLRPELTCYGATHIQSPAIDDLAAQGVLFERAYCNVPVCGASRVSLLSGVRPTRNRFLNHRTRKDEDYPDGISLPGLFRQHGYTTISNGKVYHHADDDLGAWDEVWRPAPRYEGGGRDYQRPENIRIDTLPDSRGMPYERVAGPDTLYFDGRIAAKSVADLRKLAMEDKPFFLAVGFKKPHLPFNAPARYWDLYDSTKIELPVNYKQPESTPRRAFHNFGELRHYAAIPGSGPLSDEMAKKLIHGYYACVSYTDAQVAKLMAALVGLQLDENTIVVLWGDHGWNLGDHKLWCKHCNFESSLHVPLIVKNPAGAAGVRIPEVVEFVDIYPSLCELAGLPVPGHLEGESFAELVNGQEQRRKKKFAVSKWLDGVTYIHDRYFYTEWIDDNGQQVERMLFDHAKDPLELHNLAIEPQYNGLCDTLSMQLRRRWGPDFLGP